MTSLRVLVTGGAGYIGSVTTAVLLAAGHEVVVVDDLSTGHEDAIPAGASFHKARIDEIGEVLADWRIDAVVHFAARSLVEESMADPALYWRSNVLETIALLDAVRANGIRRFVYSSTAATYGDVDGAPIVETTRTAPVSAYGATKLAVDLALSDYAAAYGLSAVSLRYFNVAGALVDDAATLGERHVVETHLIPIALDVAAGDRAQLDIYGTDYPTPDGTCIRDYIHVVDLADAHVRALSLGDPGTHTVINLGSGSGYSVREVVTATAAVTGRAVPVREAPRRLGDVATLVASNSRAAELLGWRPTRDLTRMISDAWTFRSTRPGARNRV
ncbi:MAG TPA: UDP-glucose 4-epimerase GalE [Jatrophihabitantaceae bacterium]|nr:UDP-glucose 4-epimerase GalE [Jatrophihabitantaceae bacterium]